MIMPPAVNMLLYDFLMLAEEISRATICAHADEEGMGQVVYDLGQLYQGKAISARPSSRLAMQSLKLRAASPDADCSNPTGECFTRTCCPSAVEC